MLVILSFLQQKKSMVIRLIDKEQKKVADAKAAANNNSLIPNFSKNS